MVDTILGYIKRTKDETLADRPFNEVDSLILCQFSYLKCDGMIPGIGYRDDAVMLSDIANNPNYDAIYADERYRKNNKVLFERMLESKRFSTMKLHSYINIIDKDTETQFAALTVEFEDGTVYVVFRGTDDNLVGWKEDLNLALSKPVPGQIRSVDYLEDVAKYIPGDFIVGGHSKGGNLSVFSAMYSGKAVRDRIKIIYNHDGPGVRNELLNEENYKEIRDRIRMTVPHSSIVGMLLLNHDNYRVVDCRAMGILQHDPFNWKVKNYEFKLEESVKESVEIKDRSINEWVMSLDEEQITLFVDTVYDIMLATEAQTLNDIIADWAKVLTRAANALKDIDDETKDIMIKILAVLYKQAERNAKIEISNRVEEFKLFAETVAADIYRTAAEKTKKIVEKK